MTKLTQMTKIVSNDPTTSNGQTGWNDPTGENGTVLSKTAKLAQLTKPIQIKWCNFVD